MGESLENNLLNDFKKVPFQIDETTFLINNNGFIEAIKFNTDDQTFINYHVGYSDDGDLVKINDKIFINLHKILDLKLFIKMICT